MGRLDETVATPEEWETDPFGVAAAIIREACDMAVDFKGAMNITEAYILADIRIKVS